MAKFTYQARNVEGNIINGKMEALDKAEVVKSLRERQYYPIAIEEESTSVMNMEISFNNKISYKDLSLFCRQFAFVIQSGTPMLRALELAKEQCENKRLKEILARAHGEVQRGRALSDSLKYEDEIPELMINMLKAGEAAGKLEYVLNELSNYYTKQYKQAQKIKSATMYPKIVIGFGILVVTGLLIFIVPDFINNLVGSGGELPLPTKLLLGLSNLLTDWWLVVLIVIGVIFAYKHFFLNNDINYQRKASKRKLTLPLFGKINSQLLAGRFASTFSILSNSGLNIIEALTISAKVLENKYVEEKVLAAIEDIKKGNSIGKTLEDLNVFPEMLTQMIIIGEETGTLDDLLQKTAEYYDGEVEAATEKLVASIEPLLIIGLAAIVCFIVLALYMPMLSMMDAVNNY